MRRGPSEVLAPNRGWGKGRPVTVAFGRRRVVPEVLTFRPLGSQTGLIDVAILTDDAPDPVGVSRGDSEANWGAVVKDVNVGGAQVERLPKGRHDGAQVVKGVGKLGVVGGAGLAETRVVRRNHVEVVG